MQIAIASHTNDVLDQCKKPFQYTWYFVRLLVENTTSLLRERADILSVFGETPQYNNAIRVQ